MSRLRIGRDSRRYCSRLGLAGPGPGPGRPDQGIFGLRWLDVEWGRGKGRREGIKRSPCELESPVLMLTLMKRRENIKDTIMRLVIPNPSSSTEGGICKQHGSHPRMQPSSTTHLILSKAVKDRYPTELINNKELEVSKSRTSPHQFNISKGDILMTPQPLTRTWKRVGTKEGRLQRQNDGI
ncbi:lysosome-associated membrane glycoprotein 2, partial [Striga asiatica]